MKRVISKAINNIKEDKGTFFSAVVSFVMIFTLVNIFMFGVMNADSYRLKAEESNQVILYLKDSTKEEKIEFQKKILSLKGVSSLKYESKEVALKALEKALGVDLTEESNPLEDTFFIYLTRDVDISKLSKELNSFDFISNMDLREKVIEKTVLFSNSLDKFVFYSIIFLLIFSITIIINICSLAVKARRREIYNELKKGVDKNNLKTVFFTESLLVIFVSSIVSFVIYNLIKLVMVDLINNFVSQIISINATKEFMILMIILVITVILSYIINFFVLDKHYDLSYYEALKEEVCDVGSVDDEINKLKELLEDNFDDLREEE